MNFQSIRMITTFWVTCSLVLFCAGCPKATEDPWKQTTKVKIVTSIAPLYCFTAQIAGPDAEVLCLLSTKGPHDYSPTTFDQKLIARADIFIVNGLGLEEFLEGMIHSSGNRRMKVVRAGEHIPKSQLLEAEGIPHYHGNQLVTHKGTDPHVWLGLEEAKHMVKAIQEALVEVDPTHAAGYKLRAATVLQKLEALKKHAAPPQQMGGLVTFHDSFRYFGRSFNVPIVGVIRGIRGEETSASAILEQAKEFKAKNVKLIGVEPQYPRSVAESLAEMIGKQNVRIIELDPIETAPLLEGQTHKIDPEWYFKQMEANLKQLQTS